MRCVRHEFFNHVTFKPSVPYKIVDNIINMYLYKNCNVTQM